MFKMISASDKLTIELPLREALAVYWRQLLQIIYIVIGNLLVLTIVLLFSLTFVSAGVADVVAMLTASVLTVLTAMGSFVVAIVLAVLGSIATLFIKHWLLSFVIVVAVFLLIALRRP